MKYVFMLFILLFLSGCCCCCPKSTSNTVSVVTPIVKNNPIVTPGVITKSPTAIPVATKKPTVDPAIVKNNQKEEEYYKQGNNFIKAGKYMEAIANYNKALKINPDNAYAHWGKGNAYKGLGNYKQSLICYEMALILDPKNKDIISYKKEVEELIKQQTISIKAEQLMNEYQENEVYADNKYKGKLLNVSGRVKSVGKDVLNTMYVILLPDTEYIYATSVQCFFSDDKNEQLASLKRGQWITVRGKCKGKTFNVLLSNCEL